jgi:hypothetical protein
VRREEFEHVIGAAANITGQDEFVVIGSQAMLGTHPSAPASMLVSLEVDIYPLHEPAQADAIDGALGDGSQFQRTYGYYAHELGRKRPRPRPAGRPVFSQYGWCRASRPSARPSLGAWRHTTSCCPSAPPVAPAIGTTPPRR